MPCELEKYKILYKAYADEIRNLWQRSIFLATFMTLTWGGYGALQLKSFDKDFEINAHYHCASLGLCLIIIVLSLLWVAMAKGSKFAQEAHEECIANFMEYNNNIKELYCDLDKHKPFALNDRLFSIYAHRYSPSRINIALGLVSLVASIILCIFHFIVMLVDNMIDCWFVVFVVFTFTLLISINLLTYIMLCLKGEPKPKQTQGEKQ